MFTFSHWPDYITGTNHSKKIMKVDWEQMYQRFFYLSWISSEIIGKQVK